MGTSVYVSTSGGYYIMTKGVINGRNVHPVTLLT